jgi:hypothetical protein
MSGRNDKQSTGALSRGRDGERIEAQVGENNKMKPNKYK